MREPLKSEHVQQDISMALLPHVLQLHSIGAIVCLGLQVNLNTYRKVLHVDVRIGHEDRHNVHERHNTDIRRHVWVKLHALQVGHGGMVWDDAVEGHSHLVPVCPWRLRRTAVAHE